MFSKSQIKLIKSLSVKKYRIKHGLFIVEGKKGILDLLQSSLALESLFTTEDIFELHKEKTTYITEAELKQISNLHTPQTALALFKIPKPAAIEKKGLRLVLDNIQDPGNLGTIIRMCDWFGVNSLICSVGTVDCYNPKVVQATMGSIARVTVYYQDIQEFLKEQNPGQEIYGAFLKGENIYEQDLNPEGIIVMGNEANGISSEIESLTNCKISIPQFGNSVDTESLNVSTATAIILSEFRRRSFTGK